MKGKPGQVMSDKNIASIPSICVSCDVAWVYPGITEYLANKDVLERVNTPSVLKLLSQKRLRWLGHVLRMEDGRLPKDVLYSEFASGSRPVGRPMLRFKDMCNRGT